MKKTTLILSLFLAAGAWSGMAFANDSEGSNETTGSDSAKSVTFDFTTNQYGIEATKDNNAEYVKNATFTEGDVTITVDAGTGSGLRMWQATSGVQCRVYKQASITITAPGNITTVTATAGKGLNQLTSTNVTAAADATDTAATYTLTEPATSVTFTTTGTVQFTSITVNYSVAGETPEPPVDAIQAAREAAMAEIAAYYEAAGLYADPAYLNWQYGEAMAAATTLEEVAAVVDKAKNEVANQMVNYLTANFYWKAGEGYGSYVDGKYVYTESANVGSIWVAERLFAPSWGVWSEGEEGEGEYEVPSQYSEASFRLKNLLSGKYLAPITTDGQEVTDVEGEKEAGVFVVHCADGHLCIADDVNRNLTLDWTNGLHVVTTNATFAYTMPEAWKDKEIFIEVEGTTLNEYGQPNPVEQIQTIKVYVPKGVEFSGFGEISLQTDDPITEERYTIEAWSWETLKDMTPEEGTWNKISWEPAPTEENPWNYARVDTPVEANVYTLVLRNAITTPGYYYVFSTENMWYSTTDGQTSFAKQGSLGMEIKGGDSAGMALDITPTDGAEVESITSIIIKGAEGVNPVVCWNTDASLKIVLLNEAANCSEAEWTKDQVNESNTAVDIFNDPIVYELKLDKAVTTPGTYVLAVPAGFFEDDNMNQNADIAVVINVKETNGILSIANATINGAAYDLQGRLVKGNARGLIITKGGKQIIK